MRYLSFFLFLIFIILAGLHFFWAMGGKWGFDQVLPSNEAGQKMLNPTALDSIIVGLGLTLFGLFYMIKAELVMINLPRLVLILAGWFIPVIFFVRAVGDFRYVGFFKTIKSTAFAQMDTMIYSPLCLGLALAGFLVLRYL